MAAVAKRMTEQVTIKITALKPKLPYHFGQICMPEYIILRNETGNRKLQTMLSQISYPTDVFTVSGITDC